MEKKAVNKAKNKFLKFLPKAASAVTFQNPTFSPDKRSDINANKLKTHVGKGFSGPLISMIQADARRKPKNSSFEVPEPTSPKVSCMGQIKHKNKIKKEKREALPKEDFKPVSATAAAKKQPSAFRNVFSGAKPPGRKSDASADNKPTLPDRAASLSQMKRFASGRESLTNFDWAAQVVAADSDRRDYYSDEESEGEEREVMIPFSAPILVGGGGVASEPRKEINLWKRRTMPKPMALQVNTLVRSS